MIINLEPADNIVYFFRNLEFMFSNNFSNFPRAQVLLQKRAYSYISFFMKVLGKWKQFKSSHNQHFLQAEKNTSCLFYWICKYLFYMFFFIFTFENFGEKHNTKHEWINMNCLSRIVVNDKIQIQIISCVSMDWIMENFGMSPVA